MTTILSVPTMRPLSLIASLFFVEHFNGLQEGSFFFTRRVDGEVDIHDVEIDLFDTHGASFYCCVSWGNRAMRLRIWSALWASALR